MVGLRGVGKTVLLVRMNEEASAAGHRTARIEAPEQRSLPGMLAPALRVMLLEMSRLEQAKQFAQRGLRALAGFARKLKGKFNDIEVSLDLDSEPGLADSGDLDHDLTDLLASVGRAAKATGTVAVLFIDELQYVEETQLAALITALHRLSQEQIPLTVVGAGLPSLLNRTGSAKSYAERLFEFPFIGELSDVDASQALVVPIEAQGHRIETEAVARIVQMTQGYPYFLQEWGKHTWDIAPASPITLGDVEAATARATTALDQSFFRVRLDRLSPSERRYLRAMSELGPGPHRSGEIALALGRKVSSLAPTRSGLIEKGMVWSPAHGDTAFTVPMFDAFMKRTIPGDDWRE